MQQRRKVFEVEFKPAKPGLQRVARSASKLVNQALWLDHVNEIYHRLTEKQPCDALEFSHRVLNEFRIKWRPEASQLARIPKTGPLIVVANHPLGALEGLVMASVLRAVRDDVKIMANYMLGKIAELREQFILVDPFDAAGSTAANLTPLRESMRHLKRGGVLGIFPAGEVASFNLQTREIVDPPWSEMVARLVRKTGAPVLPIFFDGRNSILFQIAGVVHPRLRTVLLAREMGNHKGTRVVPTIGSIIPVNRLEKLPSDEDLTRYLRQRTYLLQHRTHAPKKPKKLPPMPAQQPIIHAISPDVIAAEIAALPREQLLIQSSPYQIYYARATQIPQSLREIGRLREVAFRDVGEGSGKALDLDGFDEDYIQLFLYHSEKREIAGGYRLGVAEEIVAKRGRNGLYVSTLFDLKPALLDRVTPALELGRSFVRIEYQRSFSPLMLLWKGIGEFLVRHPELRYIMGPVSISNRYQSTSKQLMVQFLRYHHCLPELVRWVQPRNPFKTSRIAGLDRSTLELFGDSTDVSELVSEIEPQAMGIPVLLRQYLKLGAKILAFNVDNDFADCVDGLMVCDMTKTDTRMLDRYMGIEGRKSFLARHKPTPSFQRRERAIA